MQFEGFRRTSHVPNLTPLIDIVFLLLIFFMLTSHFVREESIEIDLPEAETGESKNNDKILEVIVGKDGGYVFDGNGILAADLAIILKSKLSAQKDKIVRIKGDRSTNLGKTVELIDLSRKAGAEGIDIVTVKNAHN